MKSFLAGLDLGTSGVKAGLYDLEGRELAVARRPISIQYPAADQAEQDPQEWRQAALEVLREIAGRTGDGEVQGVGLCAQCPGHVLVDARGEPLGPAIIWRDRRAVEEAEWLADTVRTEDALSWIGSRLMPDPTMSPARIVWLQRHRSSDWKQSAMILQPKDFLGLLLTSKCATDAHTAFMLAQPEKHGYHPDYLRLLGLTEERLPPVLLPTSLLGNINAQTASQTGLPEGTPVFTGTIDAYCDTIAGGGFLPGQAVDVAGTSEIISLGSSGEQQGGGVFLVRLDGGWKFLCGPTQVGGSLLGWLAKVIYPTFPEKLNIQQLEAYAAAAPAGAEGLIFMPYLHGERAPIWDPLVAGAFLGLRERHDHRHFSRAVFEGVGFAVRHVLETCEEACGQRAGRIILCGGGARSRFWNEIKAAILQRSLSPLQAQASACLGSAMLAAVGAGFFPDLPQAWRAMSRMAEAILPDLELGELYNQRYREYRLAYPALRLLMFNEGK